MEAPPETGTGKTDGYISDDGFVVSDTGLEETPGPLDFDDDAPPTLKGALAHPF